MMEVRGLQDPNSVNQLTIQHIAFRLFCRRCLFQVKKKPHSKIYSYPFLTVFHLCWWSWGPPSTRPGMFRGTSKTAWISYFSVIKYHNQKRQLSSGRDFIMAWGGMLYSSSKLRAHISPDSRKPTEWTTSSLEAIHSYSPPVTYVTQQGSMSSKFCDLPKQHRHRAVGAFLILTPDFWLHLEAPFSQ